MDDRLLDNARLVLEVSCRAQPGETLLVVADHVLRPFAPALAAAAVDLGLVPAIIDITHFITSPAYRAGRVYEPLRVAMEAADIVIGNTLDVHDTTRADFSRLVGDPDAHDRSLTAERRWVYLQSNGMADWAVDREAVANIRRRTLWLLGRLRNARQGRITSALGTDFSFELGPLAAATPILGIVPFYGEVAIVPSLAATAGTLVIDGPSQLDVRPASETGREPLRIQIDAGRFVSASGDPQQLTRLQKFMASGDPPAGAIDEVGILTTTLRENDIYYWSDGTHHHDRVHVALGNNARRDQVVHGPRHMDLEISRPAISIDGLEIVRDGVFVDDVLG
ncbi:MAG: hypothetical protein ACM30E_12530 [Nitrososphaerales archaeon]